MPDITVTVETTPPPTLNVFTALLPTQTGNAGKILTTNGFAPYWTNEPSLKSLRITDGVYPYLQITNTGAPTDKKRFRAFVDVSGTVGLMRVNDAENVGTNLLSWDVANTANFSFPVAITTANDTLATFSGSPGAGGFTGIRVQCADASASAARIAFLDFANETGANVASIWAGVEADGSTNLRFLTTPAGSRSGDRRVERFRVKSDGPVLFNGTPLSFTDTAGTNPNFACQNDNNFVFYGTKTDGTPKAIFSCFMRSSTSQPLQFIAPVKIGSNGGAIGSILTAGFFHTPATIAANGGVQFLDVTLTGADSNTVCFVECNGGMNVNAIILKANVISTNVVRVYWINPTPSSVSLTGQNYRVCAVTFI